MTGQPRRTARAGTIRLLTLLSVSILAAEAVIMLFLQPLRDQYGNLAVLADSLLLTAVLFSILYFLVFNRLVPKNEALAAAQRELSAAYEELERQFEERTKESERAKRDLEISLERFADIAESAARPVRIRILNTSPATIGDRADGRPMPNRRKNRSPNFHSTANRLPARYDAQDRCLR